MPDPLTFGVAVAAFGNAVSLTANSAVTVEALKSSTPGKGIRSRLQFLNKDATLRNFREGHQRAVLAIKIVGKNASIIDKKEMINFLKSYDSVCKERQALEILIPQTQSLGVFNGMRISVYRRSKEFSAAADTLVVRAYNTSADAQAKNLKSQVGLFPTVFQGPAVHDPTRNHQPDAGLNKISGSDTPPWYLGGQYRFSQATVDGKLCGETDPDGAMGKQDAPEEADITLELQDGDSQVVRLKCLKVR
ncbi:hypothetical protein BXZ70DRAFT_8472 [Cristinia sonorae]|uniref:Uncharacterized protein n=1 Tax=Cristinia sonorae TaxID=1940300 RepID=A0A8K0XUW5_9AGAR|nr:hypothetical protein BXZ70DRAFT_8472 [Cristinia sonorae]